VDVVPPTFNSEKSDIGSKSNEQALIVKAIAII
jgi:hypothetical protein